MATSTSNLIIFNQTKGEEFNFFDNFRQLHRHIRNGWEVEMYLNVIKLIIIACKILQSILKIMNYILY